MKKLTCLMTYFLALVTTAALALDLTPYETRARKDTVANSAQIVTDVDMGGVANAVQVELDGKTAPAGVTNIVTAAMSNRTVTVNGVTGSLNSNLVFTVETTNRVTALHDSRSASYFQTVENGTGTVWEVTGPHTNYTVTLSEGFHGYSDSDEFLPFTTTNFPFEVNGWSSGFQLGFESIEAYIKCGGGDYGYWKGSIPVPVTLEGQNANSYGTAVVSLSSVYYSTNVYSVFATTSDVQAVASNLSTLRSDFENYHPPTTDVLSAVAPSTLTMYGSNSITNETGFGAFLSTNNATNVNIVAVDPVAGQVIASYLYRVTADHVSGAATLSHHLTILNGPGTTSSVATVVQAFDPAGISLASNTVGTFRLEQGLIANTNIVASFALPSVVSGGVVRVSIVETIGSTRDVTAKTGGGYPMALTLNAVPIPYATTSDLDAKLDVTGGTATNLTLMGITMVNGVALGTGSTSANSWINVPLASFNMGASGAMSGVRYDGTRLLQYVNMSAATSGNYYSLGLPFWCDCAATGVTIRASVLNLGTNVYTSSIRNSTPTSSVITASANVVSTNNSAEFVTLEWTMPCVSNQFQTIQFNRLGADTADTGPDSAWLSFEYLWLFQ